MSSADGRALLLGDVVHCPVQLVDDEWAGLFDVDPDLARRTRTALNRELEAGNELVAAAHFPGCTSGDCCEATDDVGGSFDDQLR